MPMLPIRLNKPIFKMSGLAQCHYCNEWKDKASQQTFIAKCCIKRCSKHYCIDCIKEHFNPDFEPSQYRKDTWICFNCQNKCTCETCKNQELNILERKGSKRKTSKSQLNNSRQNQESVDVQSVSNISVNNSKAQDNTFSTSLGGTTSKAEVEGEANVMDTQVHERHFISPDDIMMMPFFLQKIAKRKNAFFSFMSKNYKAEKKEKNNNKIKQLINRALEDRKGDSQEIDIQSVE